MAAMVVIQQYSILDLNLLEVFIGEISLYAMAIEFEMKQQDCIFNSISRQTNFDVMSHEVTGMLPVNKMRCCLELGIILELKTQNEDQSSNFEVPLLLCVTSY